MENSLVISGNSNNGKQLQQVLLNVNGQEQLVELSGNVSTLRELQPFISQYLPQGVDKYKLIVAETRVELSSSDSQLPVEKAKLVLNGENSKFTLGLYAIPIRSKAGAFTRNELVAAVKAIIASDPTAKAFFTVDGKQYNMLKTDVLESRYNDYNAKTTKAKTAKVKEPVVKTVKAAKSVKADTKVAEVVESVKAAKTKKALKPVTAVETGETVTIKGKAEIMVDQPLTVKQQLLQSISNMESIVKSVYSIVESLPEEVAEQVETKAAIEETVYSIDEYLNSIRNNYSTVCRSLRNTNC